MFVVRLCTLEMKKWLLVVSLIHANANSVPRRQFLCFLSFIPFFSGLKSLIIAMKHLMQFRECVNWISSSAEINGKQQLSRAANIFRVIKEGGKIVTLQEFENQSAIVELPVERVQIVEWGERCSQWREHLQRGGSDSGLFLCEEATVIASEAARRPRETLELPNIPTLSS